MLDVALQQLQEHASSKRDGKEPVGARQALYLQSGLHLGGAVLPEPGTQSGGAAGRRGPQTRTGATLGAWYQTQTQTVR